MYKRQDLDATFESDPAAASKEEILFAYPELFAIFVYRVAHELYLRQSPMIPRIMSEYAHSRTGIDIHPGAQIGAHFFIDHGTGIVEMCIRDRCTARACGCRTRGRR